MTKNFFIIIALTSLFLNSALGTEPQKADQVSEQAKQVKNLISRLESLENTVYDLKQELGELKKAQPATISNANIISQPNTRAENNIENQLSKDSKNDENSNIGKKSLVSEEKEKYDIALGLLKDSKFVQAEEKFAEFISLYPDSNLQSNAYFWYSESFFLRANYNQAAINYLKGYKLYPKGAKASEALLKLSFALNALNKKQEACSMLEKLDAEFPSRPLASVKRAIEARTNFGCPSKKKN